MNRVIGIFTLLTVWTTHLQAGGDSLMVGPRGLVFAPNQDSGGWLRAGQDEFPLCFATDRSSDRLYFGRIDEDGSLVQSQVLLVGGESVAYWAIEDFDEDGDDDLIVASEDPDQVSLVFQRDGTFEVEATIETSVFNGNIGVAVGDFNADGLLDLCVGGQGVIRVFPASSPWVFPPGDEVAITTNTGGAWAGALDEVPGDEIVSRVGNGVKLYTLIGDSLIEADSIAVGFTPQQIFIGDLRGFGEPEILVSESRTSGTRMVTLDVVEGELVEQSSGVLQGAYAGSYSVRDLDGDGLPDLLVHGGVTSVGYGMHADLGSLPFGSGPVILGSGSPFPSMQNRPQAIDIGGDGFLDFATRQRTGFRIFAGDGDRFQTRVLSSADESIASKDLVAYPPSDPREPGILAVSESADAALTVSLVEEKGFRRLEIVGDDRISLGDRPFTRFGDLNGDTIADYAGIGDPVTSGRPSYIFWALGTSGGGFGVRLNREIEAGVAGSGTALLDWDGDSLDDVVYARDSFVSVNSGTPSGLLLPEFQIPIPQFGGGSSFADMDADGSIDIVRFEERERIQVVYNLGDGSVGQVIELSVPSTTEYQRDGPVLCVDINGDRELDIVVPTRSGIGVAFSAGFRTYNAIEEIPIEPSLRGIGRAALRACDLNGDGYTEVILFAEEGFAILGFDAVRNLEAQRYGFGLTGYPLIHDFDGDGRCDIVLANDGAISVYFNQSESRCLADHAPDGLVNFLDLGLFLADLVAGRSFADLDRNGQINFIDLGEFLSALSEGCSE